MQYTMRNRVVSAVAFVAVMLGLMCIAPSPAHAQETNCDTTVTDDAGLFGSDIGSVREAAASLEALGADVRVRTIQAFSGHNTLDDYVFASVADCDSWQAENGEIKPDLLVIIIAVDERRVATIYGAQWKGALDAHYLRIHDDLMGPRFRTGDFAGGFVAGMGEMVRVINARQNPGDSTAPTSPPVTTAPRAPLAPSEPFNWAPLGIGFVVLLALAGLIFGVVALKRHIERARALAAARGKAQREAQAQKATAASLVMELDEQLGLLSADVTSFTEGEETSDIAKQLLDSLADVRRSNSSASVRFAEADRTEGLGDPAHAKLAVEVYERIAAEHGEIAATITAALAEANSVSAHVSRLRNQIASLEGELTQRQDAVADLEHALTQLAEDGFRSAEADRAVEAVGVTLRKAESAEKAQEPLAVLAYLGELDEALSLAEDAVNEPRRRHAMLQDRITSLTAMHAESASALEQAREVFSVLSEEFTESTWDSVRGNGSRAESILSEAANELRRLDNLAGMKMQQWDNAAALAAEIEDALASANGLSAAIVEREADLRRAMEDLPEEIDAAGADIRRADAFIAKYDDDITDGLWDELADARDALTRAREELAQTMPDYLAALRLAKQANAAADRILDDAQDEYEAMERQRARAASAKRDAERALREAKSYISNNGSDVGSNAERRLREAERKLASANSNMDLATLIAIYIAVDSASDSALTRAKRDVSDAAAARRRARSSSYSSSSSSGGGSSSFGGGFGGGSSSFGGGGFSGGGSSGW